MTENRLLSALALCSILSSLGQLPALAADPFYTSLFERGVADLELGRPNEAQRKLRTACFGFLDEPSLLAEGLMQLGRAQALAGDTTGLLETVERLEELDQRFGSYSGFDGPIKAQFESSTRLVLPKQTLDRIAIFGSLPAVAEPLESAPEPSPKQQRKALEQRLASNPDDAEALITLSRMQYDNGKPKSATSLLDRLLALQPGHREGLCLRAQIAVERKRCEPVLKGLDNCPALTATAEGAAVVLQCLVSTQRIPEARALLEGLPIERRQLPRIARLEGKLAKLEDETGTAAAEARPRESAPVGADLPVPEDAPAPTTGAGLPRGPIEFALEERIRGLRQEVTQSRFREELDEAMQHAVELADQYPDSAEAQHLAAEVAYLSSRWQAVVDYSARGGRAPADRPELLFYLAIATYELGRVEEADSILREAIPKLQRSPFVDTYINRILIPRAPD